MGSTMATAYSEVHQKLVRMRDNGIFLPNYVSHNIIHVLNQMGIVVLNKYPIEMHLVRSRQYEVDSLFSFGQALRSLDERLTKVLDPYYLHRMFCPHFQFASQSAIASLLAMDYSSLEDFAFDMLELFRPWEPT